ncbi:hypothetical protein M2141_001742 [Lachnospiraceae bacterium PH5-48]
MDENIRSRKGKIFARDVKIFIDKRKEVKLQQNLIRIIDVTARLSIV